MAQVMFRDGRRDVPEHVAKALEPFDTILYTYDQAIDRMNKSFLENHLNRAQDRVVRQHFDRYPTK